jgi:hypothetical protein
METNIIKKIAHLDKKLNLLRGGWIDALPEKKSHWMKRINDGLDERLKLMKQRDA